MISYNKFRVRWQIWKEVLNNFNVEKWKHKKYAWDEQNYIRQQLFASLRDSKDFHYAVDISDFESYSIISCVKKSKFFLAYQTPSEEYLHFANDKASLM